MILIVYSNSSHHNNYNRNSNSNNTSNSNNNNHNNNNTETRSGMMGGSLRYSEKGQNGVSTNGVTANSVFFDGGTFWVSPLTYFYIPKNARADFCSR